MFLLEALICTNSLTVPLPLLFPPSPAHKHDKREDLSPQLLPSVSFCQLMNMMQRQDNLPSNRKSHSDTPKVCFHQNMFPRDGVLQIICSVILIFACYFKLTCCLLDGCFFPNRTITVGRKLTLNMHFSCTLSGSCSHSLPVSLIYCLHLPSSSFSLIVSHFHLSYSYLPYLSSLIFFPYSILPLSPAFPISYFPSFPFSILPVLLTPSPVPFSCIQKIMF